MSKYVYSRFGQFRVPKERTNGSSLLVHMIYNFESFRLGEINENDHFYLAPEKELPLTPKNLMELAEFISAITGADNHIKIDRKFWNDQANRLGKALPFPNDKTNPS